MATDNPFTLGGTTEDTGPDAPRRKKLAAFGLSGGISGTPAAPSLEEAPLYGGEISKEGGSAAETAAEPSQLATERVQRAPYTQEATPLLGPEERFGNTLTGEAPENTYQPLSQDERQQRLGDFFGAVERGQGDQGGTSRDVGGADGSAGASAGQAINYAKLANKLGTQFGQPAYKALSSLFNSAGGFGASFPSGLSLGGAEAIGPQFGSGLTLTGQGAGGLNPADFSLGVGGLGEAAGAGTSGIGNLLGPIGSGVGGALTLASLINGIVSGRGQDQGQYAQAAISSIPGLVSALGPTLGIAGAGLGGGVLGAALLPMMIPAVQGIVDMFKDPNLPYNSGNMSQYKSRAAAAQIPGQLNQWLLQQNDPRSLLGLATGKMQVAPNQEVQGYYGGNTAGAGQPPTGALWGSDPYNQALEGALSGDPEAIRNFIGNFEFRSGETGLDVNPEAQLTDTYRRQLAHALGLTPEQTQGLFNYGGQSDQYGGLSNAFGQEMGRSGYYGSTGDAGLGAYQNMLDQLATYSDPNYSGNFGGYSSYYRDPAEGQISPQDAAMFQQQLQQLIAGSRQNLAMQSQPDNSGG